MKLGTARIDAETCAVVLVDGDAVEIRDPTGERYPDIGALLRDGDVGLVAASDAARGRERVLEDWLPVRPVLSPGATFCVGFNYRSHLAELGREAPAAPSWFDKLPRTLADPDALVEIPAADADVDYEGELAIVIGRPARGLSPDNAWSVVAGVTLFNDVSSRVLQFGRNQAFFGKNLEGSTAVGPVVVTREEIGAFDRLVFEVKVNGELRQSGRADDLIFDVPTLLADLSSIMTLQPGDVVATGTPAGIGMSFDPPRWLADGDRVEVSNDLIGTLSSTFAAKRG